LFDQSSNLILYLAFIGLRVREFLPKEIITCGLLNGNWPPVLPFLGPLGKWPVGAWLPGARKGRVSPPERPDGGKIFVMLIKTPILFYA
jgi:hypothetical protein